MEKNKGGRPPKYKTREELQAKIDEYFDSCWVDKITQVTDKDGNITESNVRYQDRPYTIMGLALALGMTRETLCQYAKDGRFSDIVKKAKQTVEMYVEEMLLEGKNAAGPIFWLKNHAEYRDKTEQEHTGKDGGPIQVQDLTNDELLSIINNGRR
ncbi:MAG: DNA-packaging protein [Deltaproteobacteria bacterium]|nr:DNA-packaging protein [Deltaproteobacteria bacterium]